MRDFPVFDTPYGIASLTLKEIPYRKIAYVRILEVFDAEHDALLRECVDFCRVCGAERVVATGDDHLQSYPTDTVIFEMCGQARVDATLVSHLFPVTRETVSRWREIYNLRMRDVACASTLESRDEEDIVGSNGAYFVHESGVLLGIGWVQDGTLRCVASTQRAMGERVMHTLLSIVEGEQIRLEVAESNSRAIALYEKCGFTKTRLISRWYRVL